MFNLTPHAIVIRTPEGDITIPPSGLLARVETEEIAVEDGPDGIPTIQRRLGEYIIPDGVPTDVPLLVSSLVLEAAQLERAKGWGWDENLRQRMYVPDTGPTAIRENGRIIAVTRLVRYWRPQY